MVTAGAPLDVERVVERVITDPAALCERILQQVLTQLWQEYGGGGDEGTSPEETIATVLGDRLVGMIVNPDGSVANEWPTTDTEREELARYEELLDRDTALAAALGACECWGQQAQCPICRGAGGPGWALPDRRLFAGYVQPALRALGSGATGRPTNGDGPSTTERSGGNV
jgi:hypothetical protein